MSERLHLHRDGPVARLRMTRAQVHNAFDAGLIAALTAALDEVAADAGVRVLVLEAEGASFSAGADLNWMRGMAAASEAENYRDSLALARLMRSLDELPIPSIARVQGAAFGGGVGLVACCDIAIGVPEAKFGLTESKLGLLPAVISPYVIAAIGARNARRYFATAEIFSAEEAQRIGLIDEAAVDWDGKVDIDLGAEAEPAGGDLDIAGLPKMEAPTEPASGKSLADHVQIGFAYQMHLDDKWQKVRLNHVSPGRSFFVFTHGGRHKKTVSMTHRMLVRLCETGRFRAFENAYLVERATARARRQLAALGAGAVA